MEEKINENKNLGDLKESSKNLINKKIDINSENISKLNSFSSDKDNISSKFPSNIYSFNLHHSQKMESPDSIFKAERNQKLEIKLKVEKNLSKLSDFESLQSVVSDIESVRIQIQERDLIKFNNVFDSLSCNEENEEYNHGFIICANGKFKKIWDLFIFLIMMYSVIVYPYLLCFLEKRGFIEILVEIMVDFFFIVDFFLNFFTSFYDNEENIITNHRAIIYNYLNKWFILDLLTSIPFSFIIDLILLKYPNNNENYFQFLKILMCLKWLKLLSVLKLKKEDSHQYITKIDLFEDSRNNGLFIFILYFTLLIHISSCIWVFIGKFEIDAVNWIYGNGFGNYNNWDIYVASIYFNLVTIYSIGYGDIIAKNMYERAYISIYMSIGVILFSFTISTFSLFLTNINKKTIEYNNNLDLIGIIEKDYSLPTPLYEKIKKYLRISYMNSYDERYNLLESLPTKIKSDLTIFMFKNHIKELFIFKEQSNDFILFVLPLLITQKVNKGDTLISIGESVNEMFMVIRGSLSLNLSEKLDYIEVFQVKKNQNFGELFLETNEQCPLELKGKSRISEILVLRKKEYFMIKNNFSENITRILKKSYQFLEIIDKRKKIILELIKFDDNPDSIKKMMKILNNEFMINKFDDYFHNNGNLDEEDVDFILNKRSNFKEILENKNFKSPKEQILKLKTIEEENELNLSKSEKGIVINLDNKENPINSEYSINEKQNILNSEINSFKIDKTEFITKEIENVQLKSKAESILFLLNETDNDNAKIKKIKINDDLKDSSRSKKFSE